MCPSLLPPLALQQSEAVVVQQCHRQNRLVVPQAARQGTLELHQHSSELHL